MEALLWSLGHRPYVTGFMIGFFLLSVREQGWLRTWVWVITSYLLALSAEWGSIRHGIPFGDYQYHYDALSKDLVILGVPFFDTISFSFLSYVSYSFALYFLLPLRGSGYFSRRLDNPQCRRSLGALFLGSVLMVVIDLIVDPIANLGEHWFLGKIYDYPNPGIHFGVTFANYAGWFAVALATLGVNQRLDLMLERAGFSHPLSDQEGTPAVFAPLFWISILGFQLGITWWIALSPGVTLDPWIIRLQAVTGSFIVAPIVALALVQPFRSRDSGLLSPADSGSDR